MVLQWYCKYCHPILREINFGKLWTSKIAFFTILEILNFEFRSIWEVKNCWNVLKSNFRTFEIPKNDFFDHFNWPKDFCKICGRGKWSNFNKVFVHNWFVLGDEMGQVILDTCWKRFFLILFQILLGETFHWSLQNTIYIFWCHHLFHAFS